MKTFFAACALSVVATPALAVTFSNSAPITVVDAGETSSSIVVSGVSTPISGLTVTLSGLSHTYPDDLVFGLLNQDLGLGIILMSGVGGSIGVSDVNLTFSDGNPVLPASFTGIQVTSGTYSPSNYGGYEFVSFDNTATLSGFDGLSANGTWTLFVDDVSPGDGGDLSGGWSLSFAGASPAPEVASWAMMIVGFGMIGTAMRRRQRVSVRFG